MTIRPIVIGAALACAAAAQDPPQPPKVPPPAVMADKPAPPRGPRAPKPAGLYRGRSTDARYERGASALDAGRWDDARQIFEEVANAKGPRADGALYWKAYAESRLGRSNDALATLKGLRQQYPSSEWLNDAQALTVEIQQKAGKPIDPEAEANEEIKLMAIEALGRTEPERALPLLEKILKSTSSPRMKDKALFVLTQIKSPQAQQLLVSIAKGGSNPDMQLRALRYMAIGGNRSSSSDILAIYNASHNSAIKRQALQSLMMAKASDELFNIAKSEQEASLREEAIRYLGMLKQTDKLFQLYQSGIAKENVLESMFLLNDPAKVLEIARNEKDPKLRAAAIRSLGLMHSTQAGEGLVALYGSEQDMGVKKQIVESLFIQHNAKGMIEIARKEKSVEMKRNIIEKLSMMHSKEGTEYMLEMLK
jgi:HEAT repeat protein